jgi:hypothetical protein
LPFLGYIVAPLDESYLSTLLELGVPVVDQDRPGSGITAIFDSQQPTVRGVLCTARCLLRHCAELTVAISARSRIGRRWELRILIALAAPADEVSRLAGAGPGPYRPQRPPLAAATWDATYLGMARDAAGARDQLAALGRAPWITGPVRRGAGGSELGLR